MVPPHDAFPTLYVSESWAVPPARQTARQPASLGPRTVCKGRPCHRGRRGSTPTCNRGNVAASVCAPGSSRCSHGARPAEIEV